MSKNEISLDYYIDSILKRLKKGLQLTESIMIKEIEEYGLDEDEVANRLISLNLVPEIKEEITKEDENRFLIGLYDN